MTAPSLGGFGGYNPNNPPPGYDPICWRATNWDLGHGLQCYAPKYDTLKNTYNTLTSAQKAQADALLQQYDDPTMLITNLRSWLPWTMDFGAYPPPADSAFVYLGSAVLPWPGKLTGTQSRALYAAVAPRLPNLSNAEFLTILAKVKADNPENPNVIEYTPPDPTPKATTTFDNGVVFDGTDYILPDGTRVKTAAEAGVGPTALTPPPTVSGSIPPGPTSNTDFNAPTTTPIGVVTVLPPTTATGGSGSSGSAIPQISPTGTATPNATAPAATTPAPTTAPNNNTMLLLLVAAVVVLYFVAE
jgi:hypothetical protein